MHDTIDIRFIIYALISQVANKSQIVMDLGMEEITSKQLLPLLMIQRFDYEPTLKEIAEKCGITHQSAKQILDKLVEKDFVLMKRDEADKRCLRYSLTKKGEKWGKESQIRNQAFMQELFSEISEEELTLFLGAEKKLLNKLDIIKSNPEYWRDKLLSFDR